MPSQTHKACEDVAGKTWAKARGRVPGHDLDRSGRSCPGAGRERGARGAVTCQVSHTICELAVLNAHSVGGCGAKKAPRRRGLGAHGFVLYRRRRRWPGAGQGNGGGDVNGSQVPPTKCELAVPNAQSVEGCCREGPGVDAGQGARERLTQKWTMMAWIRMGKRHSRRRPLLRLSLEVRVWPAKRA